MMPRRGVTVTCLFKGKSMPILKLWSSASRFLLAFMVTLGFSRGFTLPLFARSFEKESPRFTHSADLRLLWIDELKRPSKNKEGEPPSTTSTEPLDLGPKGARGLGLEYVKLGLSWHYHESSQLHLNLRPDASLPRGKEGAQSQAVDTRAGDIYKPASPVQLLDSYQLILQLGPSAYLAVGVWEELARYEMSYSPLIAYGLQVKLPEYFSGLKLSWGGQEDKPKLPGSFNSKFAYEIIAIQGDNDRAEYIGGREQPFDQALIVSDPYVGGAARVLWWPFEGNQLSFLFGYGEEGDGPTRSTQTYGDFGLIQQLSSSIRPVLISWNARYMLESFNHSAQDLDSLYQFSFSGTSSIWMLPQHRFLLGAHIGRSERHSSISNSENVLHYGHQMDLGWSYHFAPGLNLQFMLSEEHREVVNENDEIEDAFRSAGEVKKMLRRFAIAIQYQVDQGL